MIQPCPRWRATFATWTLTLLLLGLLLGLAACLHRRGEDPAGPHAIERLRQAPRPYAYKAECSFRLDAPELGLTGSTGGTLILHRPSELYLQVRGPLGGVLFEMTVNEDVLGLRLPQKGLALQGRDPEAVLRALSGEALGVDALLALLTGRLPKNGLETLSMETREGRTVAQLRSPPSHPVLLSLDARGRDLGMLEILDTSGRPRLEILYGPMTRVERDHLPEQISIRTPGRRLSATLKFRNWEILGQIPEVFSPATTGLVVTTDLAEAARRWLEDLGGR
jgi:hypothetical protein